MEIPTLKIESRKAAGSRAAARLRRAGKLPAVIYGHGQAAEHVAIDSHEVEQLLHRGMHIVRCEQNGKAQPCQFKDAQYDHLGSHLIHLDMMRVSLDERVTVTVPLEFRGTPKGQAEGGVFRHEMGEIEIECLVTDIPDNIRVDISNMAVDSVLHVGELQLPPNITTPMDTHAVVAVVRLPHAATEVAAPVEGGPAEPEVIAKGKVEEEGAEE